jgi:hypothetical protein
VAVILFDNRTMTDATPTSPTPASPSKADGIAAEIRSWWAEECTEWDAAVTGADRPSLQGGADLWDGMPTVDSKAVARTSPIFERHLGVPLNVKLIRPGGYASIDDVITDLVPKMEAAAQSLGATGREDEQ